MNVEYSVGDAAAFAYGGHSLVLFRGDSLSVLSMRSCIRLNSIFLFFLAFGFLK